MKAETDFRDLIRKPEKLFGYSFFYFLAAALCIGMLYVWNLSGMSNNSITPLVPADSAAFALDIPLKSSSILPPVDVMKAGVASETLITRGRDLFRANCASCHGDNGMGDGAAGVALNPKPRNFHSLAGWTNGSKVSQIYKTLDEGIVRNGMASYGYLPPEDRFALAHYVRTFTAGQPVDTPEELQGLETTYQLSKGKAIPAQIPVRKATRLVLSEQAPSFDRIASLTERVMLEQQNSGAQVLVRTSRDLQRVLTAFFVHRPSVPDLVEFTRIVSHDPLTAGFKPSVLQLTGTQWADLHAYLVALGTESGGRPS